MCKGKSKLSIHAEELAIKYCLKNNLSSKYCIYIWRWSKDGRIKSTDSCHSCTHLAKKYNFTDRIFTFQNGNIISAIVENPQFSIGNYIKDLERKVSKI